MRLYIPLVVSDLVGSSLPEGVDAIILQRSDKESTEQVEEASEVALEEAAFLSLQRCTETDDVPTRIVAVAVVASHQRDDQTPGALQALPWEAVESIMADGPAGQALARRALDSTSQADVDQLVEALFEIPLSWYDVSERPVLAQEILESPGAF